MPKFLNKHGIDAFLITEEVMAVMEDHGFVIGVPVWDCWLVWHMLIHRFKIRTKLTPGLLHLIEHWSRIGTMACGEPCSRDFSTVAPATKPWSTRCRVGVVNGTDITHASKPSNVAGILVHRKRSRQRNWKPQSSTRFDAFPQTMV